MSCTQNLFSPTVKFGTPARELSRTSCSLSRVSFVPVSALSPTRTFQQQKFPRLVCSSPKTKKCAPICFFGGKNNSRGENKTFSWDSLKDAIGGLRQKDIVQDTLRGQMKQREFNGGDGDGDPPRRGGGGGGDSGGTEDEGFAGTLNEALQVFLATLGFIFVYIYIIRGAELLRLGRDYIKYLFGGAPSMRLQRAMAKWRKLLDNFSYDADDECDDWLERLIIVTPTWWYHPEEIVRAVQSRRRRDHHRN